MMVDIDGDVLVFLELAQVGHGGTGPMPAGLGMRRGAGWCHAEGSGSSGGGGDAVLAERTTGSGLGCLWRNRVNSSCFPGGPCRGGSDVGSISSSFTAPTSLPTGASITSAPTTTTSAASSPGT